MNTPSEDPLDQLLDRWSEAPAPSPRLSAKVWQIIATQESRRYDALSPWSVFVYWLGRPVFAVGFVTACALLGLLLAEVRISHAQRERNAQLARSYLQLIDPLLNSTTTLERRS